MTTLGSAAAIAKGARTGAAARPAPAAPASLAKSLLDGLSIPFSLAALLGGSAATGQAAGLRGRNLGWVGSGGSVTQQSARNMTYVASALARIKPQVLGVSQALAQFSPCCALRTRHTLCYFPAILAMLSPMDSSVLDRRTFLLGASAAAALAPLLAGPTAAQDATQSWEQAVKKIAGDAQPISNGKFTFDLPEIADNGNMVPFSVDVASPMTDKEHVKAIHVIATANPLPNVASFYFTPMSGRAAVASRMRLARTQDVICLAATSDGKFLMVRRPVKVTIGGCGG